MLATNEEELCMAPPDSTKNAADPPKAHPSANKSNHASIGEEEVAPTPSHLEGHTHDPLSRNSRRIGGNREVRRDRPTGSAVGDFA